MRRLFALVVFAALLLVPEGYSRAVIPGAKTVPLPTAENALSYTTGIVLWYIGNTGVTLGTSGKVSGWADQSGSNHNASQATDAARPVQSAPAVQFFGTTEAMSIGSFGVSGTKTIAYAFKRTSTVNAFFSQFTLKDTGGSFTELLAPIGQGGYTNFTLKADSSASGAGVGFSATPDKLNHVVIFTYNGGTNTSTGSYTGSLDGTSQTVVASGTISRTASDLGAIGGRLTSANAVSLGADSNIFELIVYSAVLSSGNQTTVVNYLTSKYGAGM